MSKHWKRFTNPTKNELQAWLQSPGAGELELSRLHPVARDAFFGFDGQLRDPFPRIESHGHYVFGMLAAPTSVQDALSDFCVLHFVADFDEIVTVLRSSPNFNVTSIEFSVVCKVDPSGVCIAVIFSLPLDHAVTPVTAPIAI